MTDFRCSAAGSAEPLAGTAPTDSSWLFVEYAGPWGAKAVAESRLPTDVREFLGGLDGVRVQLIRRHGERVTPGVRIFVARFGDHADSRVETAVLDDHRDLLDLDLDPPRLGVPGLDPPRLGVGTGLTPYAEPLWMVCTNGSRDRCCAEAGRPIAATLAAQWPQQTWETTHLSGHRFAGTLLALPSGECLGRLDPESAVAAAQALEGGTVPLTVSRGRAGWSGEVQAAVQAVRDRQQATGLAEVAVTGVESHDAGARVQLAVRGERWDALVRTTTGPAIRMSCADLPLKPAPRHEVELVRGE
ncbi:sucrase ferredoxin [Nocardioides limicola]|uniref:sucrase ferredoxin n=1 Tax=Nocardioides limicola TaxID=2803368 RepID=UPI00193C1400|nr:sucrase ferredoxin [Nocardioides sp. DJM-14]